MSASTYHDKILRACALAGLVCAFLTGAAAAPQEGSVPDFSSNATAWQTGNGGDYAAVAGSPSPMRQDPAHPYVGNGQGKQPTYRIGDLSNPNLKQWAKDVMKKDNDEVLAGKIAYTPASSCKPMGVPAINLQGGPFYFLQTPKKVTILLEQDHQVRHVYLDVPHSKNPKPSWYGESVGHYENGDTLVVDTIGLSPKAFVDSYRTPHTEKLHVIERFHLTGDGKNIEISITIEDPDTYNQPWQATRRYNRTTGTLQEEACAENNQHLFDYHIPEAAKSDF
jgi:hypothetical protein